ncbi:MAG TPA: hypothetical protein VHR45_00140 [Thermoanaerobaculia bacterium]|nr:hypothetical protein [Thermoanaerobaculia bacterium]
MNSLAESKPPFEAQAHQFLLEEFKALRKEIDDSVGETRLLERVALIATGAIWAWLAEKNRLNYWLIWSPLVIIVLSGLRSLAIFHRIKMLGLYLNSMEVKYLQPPYGWEHSKFHREHHLISMSAVIYWIILVILAIAVPLSFGHAAPEGPTL